MGDDSRYKELERRIAALTERIHRLETDAGIQPQASPAGRYPTWRSRVESQNSEAAGDSPSGSLETKIGGEWLNRVGIVAVLFGVSYFLKYAFDNNWVSPSVRVLIGLAAGAAVAGWSEYLRRRGYEVFSYSLTAVGIGVLYLSLWAASQLYQLVPNGLAFFAMFMLTAATIALALWQDSEIVAAFAMVGAFVTPVVLSTGENRPFSLFPYIAIVDAGGLVLLRYRPWNRLLLGSFLATTVLYASWHDAFYTIAQFPVAFSFISLFMAGFAAVPFIVRVGRDSMPVLAVILMNAGFYILAVWELFDHSGSQSIAALAAMGLGCAYFIMARLLSGAPGITEQVHWVTGVCMMIVAVPIGLESHWITIGWFVEAGGLLWIAERTRSDFLKYLGGAALVLGVVRLLVIDNFDVGQLILNQRVVTFAVAIGVLAMAARLTPAANSRVDERAHVVLTVTINVLALYALNLEIADAYYRRVEQLDPEQQQTFATVRDFAYSALWIAYGAALMAIGFWKKSQDLRWQALILIAATILKVFLYDTASLAHGYRIISFIALGLLLLATSFLYQRRWKMGT